MKYGLSKSAENDLLEIWDYTAQTWGQAQADRYLFRLEKRFLDLAMNPMRGKSCSDLDLEYLSYHEGRHLIFYRSFEDLIAIARILHERMDIFERLEEDPDLVD